MIILVKYLIVKSLQLKDGYINIKLLKISQEETENQSLRTDAVIGIEMLMDLQIFIKLLIMR